MITPAAAAWLTVPVDNWRVRCQQEPYAEVLRAATAADGQPSHAVIIQVRAESLVERILISLSIAMQQMCLGMSFDRPPC